MGATEKTLTKIASSAELLSYVINQTPILRENIDLPKQGESINGIGKIIVKNIEYRNAFLNTMNLIGLTVIEKNHWENPWKTFTDKGTLDYGQQIREIILDIADVYDYNAFANSPHHFLATEVPNVLSTLHELNYQKFYKTSISEGQILMAFEKGDLYSLVDKIVDTLYTAYEYDLYQVSKYMLARRLIDGTVTAIQIKELATKTDRDIVADIKAKSNDMLFMSPNYNPAGLRRSTKFDDQFAIVSTRFDARFTTNVLATSYFKSEAEMKAHMELCDGFGNFDLPRLAKVFAKRDAEGNIIEGEYVDGYVPLTTQEMSDLNKIPCVIVGREFFQIYRYGMNNSAEGGRRTEFENPETLKKNMWLHVWGVVSTSPFADAIAFVEGVPAVTSVTLSPATATISKGQKLTLTAVVVAKNYANKAVHFEIDETAMQAGAKINESGVLTVPAGASLSEITVTATSIFDNSKKGTATITVA